jgi:hypothetical protein
MALFIDGGAVERIASALERIASVLESAEGGRSSSDGLRVGYTPSDSLGDQSAIFLNDEVMNQIRALMEAQAGRELDPEEEAELSRRAELIRNGS